MKIKATGFRAPRFRQIMKFGDTIAALAADAGNDTGTVWVFVPVEADFGGEGWMKLTNAVVEKEDES